MAEYRILACDGGGLRGLLSALVIQKLHSESRILDRVNLFAGTSTGGLIALGLAGGLSIERIIDLFQKQASRIFTRPAGVGTRLGKFARERARAVASRIPGMTEEFLDTVFTYQDELWHPKYSGEGLREVISELFPTDPTLGSLGGKARVLVTTFQLFDPVQESWGPVTLHNLATPGNDPNRSHVVEAALCTSAAPTYFPPHRHPKLGYCIDGGLFANNPASLAVTTALEAGIPLDSIRLLSIGTGSTKNAMTIPHSPLFRRGAEDYGILGWLFPAKVGSTPSYPLLNILFEAGSEVSDRIARQILRAAYQRVEVPLEISIDLDNLKAAPDLRKAAESYFASETWPGIQGWVERNFAGS